MSDFKETAAFLVTKEELAFMKDDRGFKEYIVNHLSSKLADRIMGILEREEEIIVRQSDLRVSEYMPTISVEYRRQINWSPLVRCKDCKHGQYDVMLDFYWCNGEPRSAEWFCAGGERSEDDQPG